MSTHGIIIAALIISNLLAGLSSCFENEFAKHYVTITSIVLTNTAVFILVGGVE